MLRTSTRVLGLCCWLVLLVSGCKKNDAGTASNQDTPSTPEQIAIDSNTPINPTGKLTRDDYVLLELAQSKYYHNRQIAGPRPPEPHAAMLLSYAEAKDSPGKAVLAVQTLLIDRIVRRQAQLEKDSKLLFSQLPNAIKKSALNVALEGFPSGYNMDLEAIEGATNDVTGPLNDMRTRMVRQSEGNVVLASRSSLASSAAFATYAPLLGTRDLSATHPIETRAHWSDPVTFTINGQQGYLDGRFVELSFSGKEPVSNVLVTMELKTQGATTALSATQQGIDVFNRYFAASLNSETLRDQYFEAADASSRIQFANNYYNSMPKAGFVFVRTLNPGDTLHVPLGFASWDYVTGATVALNCDQGFWPTQEVQLYRDREAEFASCRPGATESHARKMYPSLRAISPSNWPKPPAPDFGDLPGGTQFFASGTKKAPLPATVFGFADGKVVFAEQLLKDWVPPHIVGKEVKLGMPQQQVFDLFLDKSERNGTPLGPNQWPVPPRPKHPNLPKDTKFYEYGQDPDFFVVGIANGKTVFAEYVRRKTRDEDE